MTKWVASAIKKRLFNTLKHIRAAVDRPFMNFGQFINTIISFLVAFVTFSL